MSKPKRHPKHREILVEMDRWAKRKKWPKDSWDSVIPILNEFDKKFGTDSMVLVDLYNEDDGQIVAEVLHYIPIGCFSEAIYTYCARPGAGKVVKHRIGNCPLAKEEK